MSLKTNEEIILHNPFGLPKSIYFENYIWPNALL